MNELQDPSQESAIWRVLLALMLSLAVLFGYQMLFPPTPPPVRETPRMADAEPAGPPPEAVVPEKSRPPRSSGENLADPSAAAPSDDERIEPTQAEPAEVVMENADIRLTWTNRRAGLLGAEMLNFFNDHGEPVQLVPQGLDAEATRPLEVSLSSDVYGSLLREAVYEVQGASNGRVGPGGELVMRYASGAVEVERRVRIPPQGYALDVETDVRVQGRATPYLVSMGSGIGRYGPESGWQGDFRYPRAVYRPLSGGLEEFSAGDLEDAEHTRNRPLDWLAIDSLYFTYVALGEGKLNGATLSERATQLADAQGEPKDVILQEAGLRVEPSSSLRFYAGPKYPDELAAITPSLPNLIDYGFFGILVRPLKAALEFVNDFIGNWGFSIIVLTFLINLVLAPIRIKQITSMKKMSVVQPELKAIQNKYKKMKRDDPRRMKMNEEVMALYKKHGVNPLGGCLPLVVQMPFLFAFYQMIAYSIELREAAFIWWIQDLSRPDPYYVTPLVMGATMVAQQAITPTVGDPTQKKMMMLMPVVFTFMFLNVSAGLAVYFLFSNVFGMAFQQGFKAMTSEEEAKPSGKPKGPSKKSGKRK